MDGWCFEDPPDLGVFLTRDVFEHREPILLVSHDDDGDWAFSSVMGFDAADDDFGLHHLSWLVNAYPDIAELAELPRGWWAQRMGPGEPWERFFDPSDAGDQAE
jgi:hypothetical protein